MLKDEQYLIHNGARIYYRILSPESAAPRAQVAIIHGLGEHSGRHLGLAHFLAQTGYRVVLHDQRGAGQSSGLRGHIDDFNQYLDDLSAILSTTMTTLPLFILGHSMGGLIAASYAIKHQHSLTGLILSSPALQPKVPTPPWKVGLAKALVAILPRLRLASGLPLEKLAHDPEVARKYREDPLCYGKVSTKWYVESLRQMALTREQAGQITVPTLILQAGDDAFVDPEASREFARNLTVSRKKIVVYDGAYHEIYREWCKDEFLREITEWIDLTIQ